MERLSHDSRRIDQYIGRVSDITAGATACESSGAAGTRFDCVFIEALLVPGRTYRPAYFPSYPPTWQRTSRQCWGCGRRQVLPVAGDRRDWISDRTSNRITGCCDPTPGAREAD